VKRPAVERLPWSNEDRTRRWMALASGAAACGRRERWPANGGMRLQALERRRPGRRPGRPRIERRERRPANGGIAAASSDRIDGIGSAREGPRSALGQYGLQISPDGGRVHLQNSLMTLD
jgi:hypothetical protein